MPTVILPSTQSVTINLPTPILGRVTWSMTHSGPTGVGVLTPSNDTQSALFTPGTDTTDTAVVTATVYPNAPVWLPGTAYRVNDIIYDANGHKQKVTAAAKYLEVPDHFLSNTAPSESNSYLGQANGFPVGDKYVAYGYSSIGPSGISSPSPDTVAVAEDLTFSIPCVGVPPVFSTSGGVVVDNDLTWTDQGAASSSSTLHISITIAVGAPAPYYNFVLAA